jgi:hypothetical protein
MDAKNLNPGASSVVVLLPRTPAPEAAAPLPRTSPAAITQSRYALEQLWHRKLDEAIALAGACQGMSAVDDDLPGGETTPPSLRLHRRAARAYEELAAIAEAIDRVEHPERVTGRADTMRPFYGQVTSKGTH